MAFGKKNNDAATPDPADDDPRAFDDVIDDDSPPDDPGADGSEADVFVETPVVAEAPAAPNSDALLSMFQESKSEVDDLAVLTDLAGETDIDDILEELRTLRAALGITDAFEDEALAA
jgi:hypothetical protein